VKVVGGKQIAHIVMHILLCIHSPILICIVIIAAPSIACQIIALLVKTKLKNIGAGTAKVEEQLQELFPHHEVIRVDRDSTSRVGSWQKIYDRIQQNKPSILLGTQMLAKGHHFPHVTFVAILDIDAGLFSVDPRAPERTAQLIMQVAGRAGRGEHKGSVYLQSLRPDHPMLTTLIEQDYRAVAKQMLADRKVALLPPYRYAVLVRVESKDRDYSQQFLADIAQQLRQWLQILLIFGAHSRTNGT
jgi:primosomal protein N' (replication factor Y)